MHCISLKSTERAEQFWKMMGAGNISLLISSSYCKKSLKIQNWCIVTNSERCLEHFLRYLGDFFDNVLKNIYAILCDICGKA